MKHALRKYISPCGSALFMVVSTMAALIVLVTAMYMSVLSSRQVQYEVFDQEQAYVTSTSVADIVCAYIADGNNKNTPLMKKVLELKNPGESISTNGNGFASFSDTGTIEDSALGGYDVTITKLNDEVVKGDTWHIYDVAVTVSSNGIFETTHTFLRAKDGGELEVPPIDRFFTATGYVPNDVFVDSGTYNNTLYYDAEYVKIGNIVNGLGALDLNSGLICAGTANIQHDSANSVICDEPTLWAIGNNLMINSQPNTFDLGGTATEHGRLIVGGNLEINHISNFGSSTKPTDVYVLGDVYIRAEANFYGNLFVGGAAYLDIPTDGNTQIKFHNGGKLLQQSASSTLRVPAQPGNLSNTLVMYDGSYVTEAQIRANTWNVPDDDTLYLNTTDTLNMLDEAIGGSVYPQWIVDTEESVHNIIFNANWGPTDLSPIRIPTPTKTQPDKTTSLVDYYNLSYTSMEPKYVEVIDKDCTIGDIINVGDFSGFRQTIIFDTGEAGNVLNINISANTDLNGDDTDTTPDGFTWTTARRNSYWQDGVQIIEIDPHSNEKLTSGDKMNILTIGDGILVINVPSYIDKDPITGKETEKSIIYQASPQEFFGHYGWFCYAGGKFETLTSNGVSYDRCAGSPTTSSNMDVKVQKMIHDSDGCTDCADPANNKYVKCKDKSGKEGYTCSIHGGFVPSETIPDTCQCHGRIEKDKFPDYYYDGELQRPNVNTFIVSCNKSAEIQTGCFKYPVNGTTALNENVVYGYVYAPYMTYMDKSDGNGTGLRSAGGIIVSDYVMAGNYSYVFAKPDQTIEELLGGNNVLHPVYDRVWRIHGV